MPKIDIHKEHFNALLSFQNLNLIFIIAIKIIFKDFSDLANEYCKNIQWK